MADPLPHTALSIDGAHAESKPLLLDEPPAALLRRRRQLPKDATCRICLGDQDDGTLFSPCLCRGSMGYVHTECLDRWRVEQTERRPGYFRCEQCRYKYDLKRVDAANALGHPAVVPLLTAALFGAGWAATSTLAYLVLPTTAESPLVSLAAGLLLVGLVGFCASVAVEGWPEDCNTIGVGACCRDCAYVERTRRCRCCHCCCCYYYGDLLLTNPPRLS